MLNFDKTNTTILSRKRSGKTGGKLTAAFALTLLLLVLSYYFVDIPVALFCRKLDLHTLQVFELITKLGISTWYLVVSLLLFFLFRFYLQKTLYANRALLFFTAVALSGIAAVLAKLVLARYRPKLLFENGLYGFDLFRVAYEYNSFPSGHVATIFSVASILALFLPKYRIYFFALTIAVALSRIALTAHFVSDVIAGACIGISTVLLMKKFIPVQFYMDESPPGNSGVPLPSYARKISY